MKNKGMKQVFIMIEDRQRKHPDDKKALYTEVYAMLVDGRFDMFYNIDEPDLYCCSICGSPKKCNCKDRDREKVHPDDLLARINSKILNNLNNPDPDLIEICIELDEIVFYDEDDLPSALELSYGQITKESFYNLLGLSE